MKVAILSANLGGFDKAVDPVFQDVDDDIQVDFHRFTDENFPPITGLTPRFQYRIPKLFGWQMFPRYDIYIWFDASCSLRRSDCVRWYLKQLGDADAAFFKHPWRKTIKAETDFIELKLKENQKYIVPRYKNGLHKEQYREIMKDKKYVDDKLYTSTAFIYKNSAKTQEAMKLWWCHQSRYYTVDQLAQPYAFWKVGAKVNVINENQYKIGYLSLIYRHK